MKLVLIVLIACFLGACSIPSKGVRDRNRENWKLALIGEPIEKVIGDWGIPTGQIRLTGSDGGDYFIYNWEWPSAYGGLLFHSWGSNKPDKYAGGKIAQPVCKNISQKMVKAEWVCE